ncbi:Rossmann-like and DUF2520 domain-containing protein [Serpentinicella alkaliphila]|uniref:Putative short-subunit dehydrogenase-like oxidoreductase (DUF2520 family) n=1 Tax=Serpentinicella alkaliphila TaxID=1734049 RepID=A0A4R2TJT9_9FIRM|nr:DUF2520 domain-containing protein [Serpentinicella alkaliphila]TCQ03066.1 putative short-subunit dehydrogenase-like oxidoreductase (DUF2520 family) [Serpentinicella alkaliphila]
MVIGFVGAGKVAKSFGKYLAKNEISVRGYYSRSLSSAQEAAELTNSVAFDSVKNLIKECELVFITTPDDAIEEVCNHIAKDVGFKKGQIVAHMSGAASSNILKSARDQECFTYSIHPLQAFADVNKAVEDLNKTPFGIEGDEGKLNDVINLIQKCGNEYFIISKEDKVLYHAAACIVSNYLVTLMDVGVSFMKAVGIDEKKGFEALYPLVSGSLQNVRKLGAASALTGPIARGDLKTVEHHLEEIENKLPELLKIYSVLGKATVDLASKEKIKDIKTIEKMKNIWKEG